MRNLALVKRAATALLVTGLTLVVGSVASCRRGEYEKPCGQLPDVQACPVAGGGTCADPTCSAIYSCNDGTWELRETCSRDGGLPSDGGPDAKPDAPFCGDASLGDAAGPATSCPPLLEPDCDWAAAQACPAQACNGSCDGFLSCSKDGWSEAYVAYCDEDGQLVVVK